jgi:hypothetical protein
VRGALRAVGAAVTRAKPYRVASPEGAVSVFYHHFDSHGPEGWAYHEMGHRRHQRCTVSVERWQARDGTWGPWTVMRVSEPRAPNQKVLPPLTPVEKDAWAAHALAYLRRHGVCTTAAYAGVLPGWDDVQTFLPGRTPNWDSPYLWDRLGLNELPRARAVALALMALRRVVAQGHAEASGSHFYLRPLDGAKG